MKISHILVSLLLLLLYVFLIALHQCSMENSFLDFMGGNGICSRLDDGVGNLALLAIFSGLFHTFILQ